MLSSGERMPHRGKRGGQAKPLYLFFEHEQTRQMPILEDVAERQPGIDAKQRDIIRRNLRAHNQVQQSAQQREEEIARAKRTVRARSRARR